MSSIDSAECKHRHSVMNPESCPLCAEEAIAKADPGRCAFPMCDCDFADNGKHECRRFKEGYRESFTHDEHGPAAPGAMIELIEGQAIVPAVHLPTDAKARKAIPLARGLLDYFPDACAEVAELSRIGNDQHNPGQPMHWAKEKSTDHADCIVRHMTDRGLIDTDKVAHSTKVAWRALAMRQIEIDAERGDTEAIRQIFQGGTKAQIAALKARHGL